MTTKHQKRYEVIRFYTAYNPNGQSLTISQHDEEVFAEAAFNQTQNKSNYYHLMFDKENGQARFKGNRKKTTERLMYHYSDSNEEFRAVKNLSRAFQASKRRVYRKVQELF